MLEGAQTLSVWTAEVAQQHMHTQPALEQLHVRTRAVWRSATEPATQNLALATHQLLTSTN